MGEDAQEATCFFLGRLSVIIEFDSVESMINYCWSLFHPSASSSARRRYLFSPRQAFSQCCVHEPTVTLWCVQGTSCRRHKFALTLRRSRNHRAHKRHPHEKHSETASSVFPPPFLSLRMSLHGRVQHCNSAFPVLPGRNFTPFHLLRHHPIDKQSWMISCSWPAGPSGSGSWPSTSPAGASPWIGQ